MELTQHIAFISGIYLTVTGAGFLISTDFYVRMTSMGRNSDPVLINLSGACHLIVGAIIIASHWRFGNAAEIGVTLVGIAATIKGAGLILVPDRMLSAPPQSVVTLRVSAIGFLLAGPYLLYVSTRVI